MTEQEFKDICKDVFKDYGKIIVRNHHEFKWPQAYFCYGQVSEKLVARYIPSESKAMAFCGDYAENMTTDKEKFRADLIEARDCDIYVMLTNFHRTYKEEDI